MLRALEHSGEIVTIRVQGQNWLDTNFPNETLGTLRVSKHYPERDIWFFTFPIDYCDVGKQGHLNILLQSKFSKLEFHYLKVPFSFFSENIEKLDVRATGEKFDLHISAKQKNWLHCERSEDVNFGEFEQ